MEKKRDSFVFYRSFFDAISEMDDKERLFMYEAIIAYALDGKEPKLSGLGLYKVIWTFVKPLLDANWKRYFNGCKGAPHGKKGGAPEGNQNALKDKTDIF